MKTEWLAQFVLSAADQARLDKLYEMILEEGDRFIGYPCNSIFDYSPLYRFLEYPINNVGDPYLPSNFHLNTHEFECEVLDVFRQLTAAPAGSTWGYVTNGGTEGNHYGLFLARELLPDGIVYYSQEAHYSIDKILRCLNLHAIMIRSQPDGCLDLDDLREALRIHREVPAILCVTIGTTMKGAVDDLAGIHEIIRDLALHRTYIHADAALGGMILPFLEDPPPWNFAAGIDSIAISGHKMVGSPMPCGVVLAQKQHVDRIAQSVEYVGTLDTTLSGSRNAVTPLFLWYAFHTIGLDGFRHLIPACLEMADYAVAQLNQLGCHAWRHPYANTVVFDRPAPTITQRWQLASHGQLSHLITMPHVTQARIDRLVSDIRDSLRVEPTPMVPPAPDLLVQEIVSAEREITIVGSTDNLLTEISAALGAAGIMIEALTAVEADGASVLRMQVDDRDRALQILNQTLDIGRCYGQACAVHHADATEILSRIDYQSVSNEALLVQLVDQPGSLAELMKCCRDQTIPIRRVRVLWRGQGKAVVELASPQVDELKRVLSDRVLLH